MLAALEYDYAAQLHGLRAFRARRGRNCPRPPTRRSARWRRRSSGSPPPASS
ncbi:hypothetical protein ACFQRB_15680 [Halobaculum litoreum]|uniref:Uncharacterized protein n=1 Tax=Halobaculum litoreum TaxID=3031998 RepID=A0ABD5XZE9_9EURY